jgi:hypothetical protein
MNAGKSTRLNKLSKPNRENSPPSEPLMREEQPVDQRLRRKQAEWQYRREKILFYFGLTIISGLFAFGVTVIVCDFSPLLKISAGGILSYIGRAMIRYMTGASSVSWRGLTQRL